MIKPEALPDDGGVVVVEFRREERIGPKLQGRSVREGIGRLLEDIAEGRIALGEQEADPAAPQG